MANDRAPHRHPLPLSARELARIALEQMREVQHAGGLVDLRGDLGRGFLAQLQAEAHVVANVEMRIQRVALEHHRDVALARLEVVDAAIADDDVARRDRLESGDHPQQRGLAAPRRADQHRELAVGDVEVDAAHDRDIAEALLDVAHAHGGHDETLTPRLLVQPRRASR